MAEDEEVDDPMSMSDMISVMNVNYLFSIDFITPTLTPFSSARDTIEYTATLDQLTRDLQTTFLLTHPDGR